jgi:hypothetical protein
MKPYRSSPRVVALLLFFTGCVMVNSLHPLFQEDEYVALPGVVGTWGTEDETWVFENSPKSRTYTLFYTYEEKTSEFLAVFGRIGGDLYLDMSPVELDTENEVLKRYRVLGHTFYKVELTIAAFRLDSIDYTWLHDKISSGEVSIEHFETRGGITLTADTEELQALIQVHSDEMFSDPQALKKRTP